MSEVFPEPGFIAIPQSFPRRTAQKKYKELDNIKPVGFNRQDRVISFGFQVLKKLFKLRQKFGRDFFGVFSHICLQRIELSHWTRGGSSDFAG
jgi:hypothetical protein